MAGGNKTKDKFIVSFNSDTSDSEDDDVTTTLPAKVTSSTLSVKEKTTPAKDSAPVMNGHVEPRQQNGDVSTSLNITSTTELGNNRPPEHKKYQSNGPSSSSILQKTDLDNFGNLGSKTSKQDPGGERLGTRTLGSRSSDKFDDLETTSRPSSAYSSRENKTSEQVNQDLDSAYTRAKERNRLLSARKPDQELLIDLSDTNENFAAQKSSNKMETSKRKDKSYSADLEDISGFYDSKTTKSAPMVNGLQSLDFEDFDVKKTTDSADNFGFDADLLIYASSGTSEHNKPNMESESKYDSEQFDNIRSDRKYESGSKRPQALNDDLMDEKAFRKQSSLKDDKESLLSPKDKYIEDKFSAICNKYGNKRDRPPTATKKPETDPDSELYGTVRVKTGVKDNTSTKPTEEEEDLGFSEEKTPRPKLTFDDIIKWDKGSTSDLIQRILADARSESETTTTTRREPKRATEDDYTTRQEARQMKIKPYEEEFGGDHKYDYRVAEPSLLERRLASLTGSSKQQGEIEPYSYTKPSHQDPYSYTKPSQDPYSYTKPSQQEDDQFYKRKGRGASATRDMDDSDALSLTDSSAVTRYVPWKERQKARYQDDEDDLAFGASAHTLQNNRLRPPNRYDDSESDDESYRSSRGRDPVLPDEWFAPQRSEDTAIVVKERTSEARNMVDHQNEVLGRLQKASKEFDDLDAEIRALKQQCIENQVARQMVIDDILSDATRSSTYDDEPAPNPRRYTRGSYASRDSYASKYSSPSTPSYRSRSRASSTSRFDSDLDSDRLGGYALGSVARSRWGEPGGSRAFRSASVSRFDNFEEEDKSYDKYGLYTPKRSVRAGSCLDDFDTKSNHSYHPDDESECASVRSYPSDKGMDDGREEETSYRSRYGSSKYGSSLTVPSTTRSYSVSRESRSPSRRSVAPSDYSSSYSTSSYERPRTRGMSLPPPEKPFQSRFLSKVREKKASGVDISSKRDKPFKSRFLTRSFDSDYGSGSSSRGSLASTPDKSSSSSRSYRSRDISGADESAKATEATE